jgi:putative DNA primase/helicase
VFPLHSTDGRGNCTCSRQVCSNPGKHQRTKNGLLDASTNELFIRQWWKRWPNSNIGFRMGIKCVALDTDDGGAGLAEAQQYGVDLTDPHSATGNGRHYLYKMPEAITLHNKVKGTGDWVLEHCDTRAEGGYIVAPPSRHYLGGTYRWAAPFDVERLPDIPARLLAAWAPVKDDPRKSDPYAAEEDTADAPPLDADEAQAGDAIGKVTAMYYVR